MRFAVLLAFLLAGCAAPPPAAPPAAAPASPERGAYPTGSGGTNDPAWYGAPVVVLVSFDGFRHDYLDLHPTPNFDRIAAGVRADALVPAFPTLTFSNHYSIATGLHPARHGLVGNTFYDPGFGATYSMRDRDAVGDGRWYGGEPLWVTAETQGMVTASYFWVGTEAPVQGVRPTRWKPYDGGVSYEARVDSVLAWLDLPPETRPRLVLLYFSAVDTAGHRHGPDSPEVAAAIAEVDAALGRLLDGLDRQDTRANVVLVSDHGMAQPDTAEAVVLTDYVTLPDGVETMSAGPSLMLWLDEAAADSLDAILDASLPPSVRSYTRDELPARWRFAGSDRVPPLVLVAERPALVGLPRHFERPWGGAHGYAPEDPTMHGIFLAVGPDVAPAGRLGAVGVVDVYPFVAALLGLRPAPDLDGDAAALRDALRGR